MLFQLHSCPFFGEIMSTQDVNPDPHKLSTLTIPPPKRMKELQSFLGIMNYLSYFSEATAEVCKPIQKGNSLIKRNACMKFYDTMKALY